jgi:hypothetical protein
MAYLDDPDANQETARHLAQCPHCRENAETLDLFQKRLGSRLYRSTCPSPIDLGNYFLRMLPASQRLVVAQHLRQCPLCTREVLEMEKFLGDPSPRRDLFKAVKTLIARLPHSEAEAHSHRLPALRGGGKKPATFKTDHIVITLEIQPGPDEQFTILGQMAAGDQQDQWTGAMVELEQPFLTSLIASVDDLGGFTIETVFSGPTQITITSMNGIAVQTEQISFTT